MSSRAFPLALAAACLLVACIPPTTYDTYPSQLGWQQAPAPAPAWQAPAPRTSEDLDTRNTNHPRGYTRESNYPAHPRQHTRTSNNARNSGSRNSGNSNWLCTAEGKTGTSSGNGIWSWSTERARGNGPTRDDAYAKAFESCNARMTMSASLAMSKNLKRDSKSCRITSCMQGR